MDLCIVYREILTKFKPYSVTTIGAVPALAEFLKPGFRTGETGIYLGVYTFRRKNVLSYPSEASELLIPGNAPTVTVTHILPTYDIDGDNKEIPSAIDKANRIHADLTAQGLDSHTHWILTGNGIRCVFNFLIPYSLREGWIEHLKSLGIDSNPYASTKDGGIPIRLFSYRGNLKQCGEESKKIDRHCELIDQKQLSGLDKKKYLDLTAGMPDPEKYVKWAKEILPVKIFDTADKLPPEIARFFNLLQEHQYKSRIRQNIRSVSPFRADRSLDIDQVLQHLDNQGIGYREIAAPHIWKLDVCPCCGRKDHGYVRENGYLHCFADSCDATRHAGGLPPSIWVEGNVFVKSGTSSSQDETKTVSREEAEKMVAEHLNHDGNIAVAVTPGVGKTTLGIKKAMSLAKDELVIYAMPQHELIEESIQRIKASGIPVFHFKGRDDTNCRKSGRVKSASHSGYYPSQTVCFWCDGHPDNTPLKVCEYNRQFLDIATKKKGLIFCATAQLPYLIKNYRIEEIGVGTVFIDEQALAAMVHVTEIRSEFLSTQHLFSALARSILERMIKATEDMHDILASEPGRPIGKLYTADPAGTWWKNKPSLWDSIGVTKGEARSILGPEVEKLLSRGHYMLHQDFINRYELLWLKEALDEKKIAWFKVEKCRQMAITCHSIEKLSIPKKTRIIVLDATATKEELKAIFDRDFNVLQLRVQWEGKRIFLKRSLGQEKKRKMTDAQFEKNAVKIREHIPPDTQKWLLCTHKSDKKQTLARIKSAIPQIEWRASHYFADRGKNSYEDSDGVFCYGIPIFNPDFKQEQAALLFPDDLSRQLRWIDEQNTAELYQKVHRARFVRHPGKTLIVEGHHWPPILGEPVQIIDLTRSSDSFVEAFERVCAAYKTLGFFDKLIAAVLRIGIKGEESKIQNIREKVEEIFQKIGKSDLGAYRPLYKFYKSLYTLPSSPIFLSGRNLWANLLSLSLNEMGSGMFRINLRDWHAWTNAVGDMKAAGEFYAELSRAAVAFEVALAVPGSEDIREIEKSSEMKAEETIQDAHFDLAG